MTSNQGHLKIAASKYKFLKNKNTDVELSELLPELNKISNKICMINSMHTDEINHDPALCFLTTGSNRPGKPSIGSWISYGLGSLNNNLPSYITMISRSIGSNQSINSRLWSSGFLPSNLQATRFYKSASPVLFLNSSDGSSKEDTRKQIDLIKKLNQLKYDETKDPEILSRSAQYEMAYRMQTSVPEVIDLSGESKETLNLYGPQVKTPGSFANNCLLARRLIEKDVRFVHLFHRGWDNHLFLFKELEEICKDVDRPLYGLITDLEQRGLLDDTLIVSSGEFGRTTYCQGSLVADNFGRDHHGRCFSSWMAGAGIKKGFQYGKTDEFCYNVVENPVSVHELNATILNLLGIDHKKFSYFHNGLDERLTGVEEVEIVKSILS